ncbi:MAG: hypothetical protein LBG46_06895 [Elusimicrobiota bacterium]|jgi:cell division protein FtsX|nr:hypothetical protein [Elusimicrobiota bacterium]
MVKIEYKKSFFGGALRIFFLTLFFAMSAQVSLFLLDCMRFAFKSVNADFKIAAVLNNASNDEAETFKKNMEALDGVENVKEVNPREIINSLGGADYSAGELAQALNPDFLPKFYEISVDRNVILSPKAWVKNNLSAMEQDAGMYYKESHAALALRINALVRFAEILIFAAAFAFLSFCFFVEAYYIRISNSKERAYGALGAVAAFLISYGVVYTLCETLNGIYDYAVYPLFFRTQSILFILCVIFGLTLSKWKRF